MRPIDADVAIEELTDRSHQAAKRVGTDSPFWEGLVIARRIVNNLPTIQPEPKWIPVSERLPEKSGEYLVSVHHTIGAISVFHPEKDTYVDDVAIMKYYGKFPSTVRAWMPLPDPYKPNNKQSGKEGA